jgi:hypothetical protein
MAGVLLLFIAVGSPRQALWLVVPFQKFMGRFLIVSTLLIRIPGVMTARVCAKKCV